MLKTTLQIFIFLLVTTNTLFSNSIDDKYGVNKNSLLKEDFKIATHHLIKDGENLLGILNKLNIPESIYYDQNVETQESTEEIKPGFTYYVLRSARSKEIKQVLIQVNSELQFHIYKTNNKYKSKMTPIEYIAKKKEIAMYINNSIYQDFIDYDKSFAPLAEELKGAFYKTVNFKTELRKGDILTLIYEQRHRLGKASSSPRILASSLNTFRKSHYIYFNPKNERYYDDKAILLEGFFLKTPLRYRRISSYFSRKRFHPIKKIYRAHHGVDYAARKGTRVSSARNGVVQYVGRKGGYGKTIIIKHQDGYKTLYAHLSRYAKGIRKGRYVKKSKLIGQVGSTGVSTGPHLHFGLYKHGRPINPIGFVRVKKQRLRGKPLKNFRAYTNIHKETMDRLKNELKIYAQKSNIIMHIL